MSIILTCACKRQMCLPEASAGESIRCPVCNRLLGVPRAELPAPAAVSGTAIQSTPAPSVPTVGLPTPAITLSDRKPIVWTIPPILWPVLAGGACVTLLIIGSLMAGLVRFLSQPADGRETNTAAVAVREPEPARTDKPLARDLPPLKLQPETPPAQPQHALVSQPVVALVDKLNAQELDLELLTPAQPADGLATLPLRIPPRPRETVIVELLNPPPAPGRPTLSEEQLAVCNLVVDRFILYDIGRLRGLPGQQALADFNSLGEAALPALVQGVNRASTLEASCPIIVLAKKVRALVAASEDLDMVIHVRDNAGKGVHRSVHSGVIDGLRTVCDNRRRLLVSRAAQEKLSNLVALVEALTSPDATVRRNSAILIGSRGKDARDAVPALIKALQDPNEEVRGQAARALVEIGPDAVPALVEALKDRRVRGLAQLILSEGLPVPPAAIPDLVLALRDPDPEVQAVAQHALVKLGPAAVPFLVDALDGRLRARVAAVLLGHIGPSAGAAIPALAQRLNDPDKEIRLAAHHALVRIGPAAVPVLMGTLNKPDALARSSAAVALGKIGPPARVAIPALSAALQAPDRAYRVLAIDALLKIDPQNPQVIAALGEAVPVVIDVLSHKDPAIRCWAARCLGQIGPHARLATTSLIDALRDPEASVRSTAAEALGRIGPDAKGAVAALIKGLHDPQTMVRARAVEALGRIGPDAEEAIPVLIAGLSDPEQNIRNAASDALTRFRATSVPALITALNGSDPPIRRGAAEVLTRIGSPAVGALVEALQDSQSDVRGRAIDTLRRIGPDARPAAPALIRALADPSEPVRLHAVHALASCDPASPETLHALQQTLTNSTKEVGRTAQEALVKVGKPAVPVLTRALTDKSRDVRIAGAETLRKIGGNAADALPPLLNAVKDPDRDVRVHCIDALRDIDPTAPVAQQAFVNGFQDADEEVRIAAHLALVKLGKAGIAVLTAALKRPEAAIRRGAAETLKKIATEVQDGRAEVHAAVPELIRALVDSDQEVRDEAGWALAEIDVDLKTALPALVQALRAPPKPRSARLILDTEDLRFTPLPRLLEAVATERGPRLKQVLTELAQRRDTQVLVTFSLGLAHEQAEVHQLARTLLVRYLAHRPTEPEQKDAAGKLYLHKLLATSGKADKARERYRELVLAAPRTEAAEEARRLLTAEH